MILESVRILTEWLGHATYGVNALLPTVPREGTVAAPAAVTIMDSTRDARITRGHLPPLTGTENPALLVSAADETITLVAPAVRPMPADAAVTMLVRYCTSDLDTARAECAASITLRAVARSLAQLFVTAAGESARVRSSVQLVGLTDLRLATLYEATDDTIVTGGVLATLRVRDTWAHA